MRRTDLVRLSEEPRRRHEVLALEVLRDLLVPEGDVALTVVVEGTELRVAGEVGVKVLHAVDALHEILDHLLVVLQHPRRSQVSSSAKLRWEG